MEGRSSMPTTTAPLKSQPGIKRDGTKFEGDNYTDGQWVRWQRGLPRKIGGYRSVQRFLTELSRGFTTFTQQRFNYCHSGSQNLLERFTLDGSGNSSIIADRTPVAIAATGTVTLTGGAAGSVDSIMVDGVEIMSASVPFTADLGTTASNVASNITAFASVPDYTATSVGPVITIAAATAGSATNYYEVESTTTTLTTVDTDMARGSDALVMNANNKWMFGYQYDSSTSDNYILAHVAPNLSCSCNAEAGQIFFGDVLGTDPLKSVRIPDGANCTGGIVSLHPYLLYYGTDGIIGWSKAGEPTNLVDLSGGAGIARPWGQKIIKGLPLRGATASGIFWAWDAVLRAQFTGGSTVFSFDVLTSDSSILSSDCVVDYEGVFYWAGVDRFLMFNGVVREVPNTMNLNYFYEGLNQAKRSKVFAFKVSRYGEIWWCYPRGSATECTHAVVYNVRENVWYDTELPDTGRSAAHYSNAFAAPMMTGVVGSGGDYRVWLHERGVDRIDASAINSIQSYFETADLSAVVSGKNEAVRVTKIEPDFVQKGEMSVQVSGRANARAPEVYSSQFSFPETASTPAEQIVMMKEQRREIRVRFESNTIGGDYQMGQIIGHLSSGDKTSLG